ncbi:MAG: PHP domain-containing protein [Firmicutes bacterium]|nr:PHP domain-containing protein [Bacillota bacterium]
MDTVDSLTAQLNAASCAERLDALRKLKKMVDSNEIPAPQRGNDINNHIHTIYSFSPYSPSKAVWMAYTSGLCTAGIMDHDSISGAEEFIEAGKIMGLPTTIGLEIRVSFKGTPLADRRINNPDQSGVAYMALHGVPHTAIEKVNSFMAPYRAERNKRNKAMIERINLKTAPAGIVLDFERDVLPISCACEGGGVTERHVLFALVKAIVDKYGRGADALEFVKNSLGMNVNAKQEAQLSDPANPYYDYDLLGVLKSDTGFFYIDADLECMPVEKALAFADEIGAISAYAYLGDVGQSVTGDKRAQCFEDSYLDELFEIISKLGFRAVTYMPSRNTQEQLTRLRALCERYSLFQISGEDINSPRQVFICKALQNPLYHNLIDSTWALIGHEKAATANAGDAMFANKALETMPELSDRIVHYGKIGRNS